MQRVATLSAISVLGLLLAMPVNAGPRHSDQSYYDYAEVLNVKPITEVVRVDVPKRECWIETETRYAPHASKSITPEIVGAIIGGALGNRFGNGRGRHIATAAGAVLGGSIGHDMKRRHGRAYEEPVERCDIRHEYHEQEQVIAYRIKYRYDGRIYRTRMGRDPGDRIRVRVNVAPAE